LCIFIFVCTSVGLLPPGENSIAVSNNNNSAALQPGVGFRLLYKVIPLISISNQMLPVLHLEHFHIFEDSMDPSILRSSCWPFPKWFRWNNNNNDDDDDNNNNDDDDGDNNNDDDNNNNDNNNNNNNDNNNDDGGDNDNNNDDDDDDNNNNNNDLTQDMDKWSSLLILLVA
jgi:hypothetical protein